MKPDEKASIIANLHKLFGNALPKSTIEKVLDEQTTHLERMTPEEQDTYVGELVDKIRKK